MPQSKQNSIIHEVLSREGQFNLNFWFTGFSREKAVVKAKNNFELCFGPTRSWEGQEAFIRRVKRCRTN